MGIIHELMRKMNGKERTVNAAQREDPKQREKRGGEKATVV